jgi:MoaA/NifB/PqqE/SkfB family radical SAM enzyme
MCNRLYVRKGEDRNTGFLSWEVFDRVKPFFPYAERVLLGGFGEALLHSDYIEMVKAIKKCGPAVYFFTNAVKLSPEIARGLVEAKLDQICVSIGGATSETHAYVRGADTLGRVVENLKSLNRYKRENGNLFPEISFNVVAMNCVLPEITRILDLANELNVDSLWMPHLAAHGEEMIKESPWIQVEEANKFFQEAVVKANGLGIDFHPPSFDEYIDDCLSFFQEIFVTWDGKILSCALERYIMGDVSSQTIEEIWNGPSYIKARTEYFTKSIQKLCPNCIKWSNSAQAHLHPTPNSRTYAEKL